MKKYTFSADKLLAFVKGGATWDRLKFPEKVVTCASVYAFLARAGMKFSFEIPKNPLDVKPDEMRIKLIKEYEEICEVKEILEL